MFKRRGEFFRGVVYIHCVSILVILWHVRRRQWNSSLFSVFGNPQHFYSKVRVTKGTRCSSREMKIVHTTLCAHILRECCYPNKFPKIIAHDRRSASAKRRPVIAMVTRVAASHCAGTRSERPISPRNYLRTNVWVQDRICSRVPTPQSFVVNRNIEAKSCKQ